MKTTRCSLNFKFSSKTTQKQDSEDKNKKWALITQSWIKATKPEEASCEKSQKTEEKHRNLTENTDEEADGRLKDSHWLQTQGLIN